MKLERPVIEHNRHERRPTNGIYWLTAALLVVMWVGYLYFNVPDWWSLALGGYTGAALAIWAIEITGNKTPEWMKTKR